MYMLGIVQMQRGAQAQTLVAQLHASHDEETLLQKLRDVLQFLREHTNASYVDKVKRQLDSMAPPSVVDALSPRPQLLSVP